MKKTGIHLILAFVVILFSTASINNLSAQNVDIGLYLINPDTLEVRLRPDVNFSGIVSNLQFTIRWDASSGANLGAANQAAPEIIYLPMQKSGAETDDSGYRYQVFFGTGTFAMSNFGAAFSPGVEVTLLKIPVVNGCSDFAIVNDAWTGGLMNNGDYFISLGGSNSTGIIYSSTVQACPLSVNDLTDGKRNFEITSHEVTIDFPEKYEITLGLYNLKGQMVKSIVSGKQVQGRHSFPLKTDDLAPGIYLITLQTQQEKGILSESRKIVVK